MIVQKPSKYRKNLEGFLFALKWKKLWGYADKLYNCILDLSIIMYNNRQIDRSYEKYTFHIKRYLEYTNFLLLKHELYLNNKMK